MGNEKGIIGVDTGFFYALRDEDKTATRLLFEKDLVISILTVFELRRAALKEEEGRWSEIEAILEKIVTIIEVTKDVVEQAARISHGTGMPAIDSIILASLLSAGCRKVYTTDRHLEDYKKRGIDIINLGRLGRP